MDEEVGHIAPPAPLTFLHLTFLASRCYDLWASGGGGEGPKSVAEAGYRRCYHMMLEEHDTLVERVERSTLGKNVNQESSTESASVGSVENVHAWLENVETWRGFALEFHLAGLDLVAADFMHVACVKLPRKASSAKAAKEGRQMTLGEHYGDAPVEFWLESANIYWRGGQVEESIKMLEVAVEKYPESRRANKHLRIVKGKERENRSVNLKHMRRKSIEELCVMIRENLL